MLKKERVLAGFTLTVTLLFCGGLSAATIEVVNLDGPDEGFNDPEARMPVGGNPGTTLGEQRLNAFQFAADKLGEQLVSSVVIRVGANFDPLTCTPTSATLGAAGPTVVLDGFANQPVPDTFYPIALANALAGTDLDGSINDISAAFNSQIEGDAACLGGVAWYYGLDNNPPPDTINFPGTVLHELIHGMGFITFANLATGEWIDGGLVPADGTPDIYGRMILDLLQGLTWDEMIEVQRIGSAVNDGNVVWNGPNTTANAAPTLTAGSNSGMIQLFAPLPLQPGSSISHWDTTVTPDALMEPFETGASNDEADGRLALCALQDIGWGVNSSLCQSSVSSGPGGAGVGGSGSSSGSAGGGGGGGGCALTATEAEVAPLLPLLLLLATQALLRRRSGIRIR